MRKSWVLASILFISLFLPLDYLDTARAQGVSPDPEIQLECDASDATRTSDSDTIAENWGIWESPHVAHISCILHNPTQYAVVVDLSLVSEHVGFITQTVMVNVSAYASVNQSISFTIDESTVGHYLLNATARVVSANGVACSSCAAENEEVGILINQLGDSNPKLPDADNNEMRLYSDSEKCWGQFDNRTTTPEYSPGFRSNGIVCHLGHPQGKFGRTLLLDANGTIDLSIPITVNKLGNTTGQEVNGTNYSSISIPFEFSFCSFQPYYWCRSTTKSIEIQLVDGESVPNQVIEIQLPVQDSEIPTNASGSNFSEEWDHSDQRLQFNANSTPYVVIVTPEDTEIAWGMTHCTNFMMSPSNCWWGTPLPDVDDDDPGGPLHISSITLPIVDVDSDGDGIWDSTDLYPNDPDNLNDSDGDGVPDDLDAFPEDGNETHDDDGDGVGNNADAFPQDESETHDDDGDGVGNNSDAFPQDPEETADTDGDGVGDNSDADPNDPEIRFPADLEIIVTDTALYVVAGAVVLLALVLSLTRRNRPPAVSEGIAIYDSDSIWTDDDSS